MKTEHIGRLDIKPEFLTFTEARELHDLFTAYTGAEIRISQAPVSKPDRYILWISIETDTDKYWTVLAHNDYGIDIDSPSVSFYPGCPEPDYHFSFGEFVGDDDAPILDLDEIARRLADRKPSAVRLRTGLSYGTLRKLAEGKVTNYTVDTIRKISKYLEDK